MLKVSRNIKGQKMTDDELVNKMVETVRKMPDLKNYKGKVVTYGWPEGMNEMDCVRCPICGHWEEAYRKLEDEKDELFRENRELKKDTKPGLRKLEDLMTKLNAELSQLRKNGQ